MTQVPLGLQSSDFPSLLKDIEFAWTNLTSVTVNVSSKWPDDAFIMLEKGHLNEITLGMLLKSSRYVSFAGNSIMMLPKDMFTNPAASRVWLNANPISELPEDLMPAQSLERVNLSYTQLKSLPSWADDTFFKNTRVTAGDTPFCNEILFVAADEGNNSVPSHLTVVWNAYQTHRLRCNPTGKVFYPYEAKAQQDAV